MKATYLMLAMLGTLGHASAAILPEERETPGPVVTADIAPDERTAAPAEMRTVARFPKLRGAAAPALRVTLPDTVRLQEPQKKPDDLHTDALRVGYVRAMDQPVATRMAWTRLPEGGAVARAELFSRKATGLRARFRGQLTGGLEARFFVPGEETVFGPVTLAQGVVEAGQTVWWSPTVFGEVMGIEFYAPDADHLPALPEIVSVSHLYRFVHPVQSPASGTDGADDEFDDGSGTPLSCHNDVTCSSGWSSQAAAVAHYHYSNNDGNWICTGALLNRNPSDGHHYSPIFLTANHCANTDQEATSMEVYWFWQTSTCNGTPPAFNTVPRTSGAAFLKRSEDNDISMFGLRERPPGGVYYLGWSTEFWSLLADPQSATGIHHPKGSFKRISFGDSKGRNPTVRYFDGIPIQAYHLWRVDFTSGTAEGGSSGSPIMDSSGRVRGTLTGGDEGCATITKWYGRLDEAFDTLKPYLHEMPSPVYVSGAWGGSNRGTSGEPFDRVEEGFFSALTGDEVRIAPGNYAETIQLWRPMRLTRWGATGVVRIGD